jgi:hypothetical protein
MSKARHNEMPVAQPRRRTKLAIWWLHAPTPVVLVVLLITVFPVLIGIALAQLLNILAR